MWQNKPIQVFEYEFLGIGSQEFNTSHWEALGKYNDEHGGNFFHLTHNGVKFQQYVGVIQVGNITIEILPKIGREASPRENKKKWQEVLIDMLRECNWMKIYTHEKASLQYKFNSILEAYLELFINECESICRQGLIKKYRLESNNCTSLKGKLLFSLNIQKNLVHQERFYTRHQIYDRNNIFNQILLKALKIIPIISQSPLLKDRIYSILLAFPELDEIIVNDSTFENLVFDKKTTTYREAIEIAAMLLLNYRPDISTGNNNVLAILFDMNDLWEEYIYRQIQHHNTKSWKIQPQDERIFWKQTNKKRQKNIKPDIVVSFNGKTVIIDTKWKLPEDNIPSGDDLKQMFVYNEFWNSMDAILLYPSAEFREVPLHNEGSFYISDQAKNKHKCGVLRISLLDKFNNHLDTTIGERINKFLVDKQIL